MTPYSSEKILELYTKAKRTAADAPNTMLSARLEMKSETTLAASLLPANQSPNPTKAESTVKIRE